MVDLYGLLKQYWGYSTFRPLQEDIIRASLAGQDSIALLPTGGGKSLCYQLSGLAKGKLCIVISPLIALMHDQVEQLQKKNIQATFINSQIGQKEIDKRLQAALDNRLQFLYLAPEQLKNPMLLARVPKMQIGLIAVDEAHCVSQWGYDFRPAYLQIKDFRVHIQAPMMALTATATQPVIQDIQNLLGLINPRLFTQSFKRENLQLFILDDDDKYFRLLQILHKQKGSCIIYCSTRATVEELVHLLRQDGFAATGYHAGLDANARVLAQQSWIQNRSLIIVATNAFGMGIDKPDVRAVIHYQFPVDLESYYQEAGRAGRDGAPAYAIAFFTQGEMRDLNRRAHQKYPDWTTVCQLYQYLCNVHQVDNYHAPPQAFPLQLEKWSRETQVQPTQILYTLKILENQNWIKLSGDKIIDSYPKLRILAPPNTVYQLRTTHKRFGEIIERILRDMGGEVYQRLVKVPLKDWAFRLQKKESDILAILNEMASLNIIEYLSPTTVASFSFLLPRQELNPSLLNWAHYQMLEKAALQRLSAVLQYLQNQKICRMQFLQSYFGEQNTMPCGKCDICTKYHTNMPNTSLLTQISHEIIQLLQKNTLDYRNLLHQIQTGTPAQRAYALRYLLAEEKIKRLPNFKIALA